MAAYFEILKGKVAWHVNDFFFARPWLLNFLGAKVSIINHFGSPGDTLMTATVCRELKRHYPRLRINCITRNSTLIELDPDIASLNQAQNFFHFNFNYLGLIDTKDDKSNVLKPALSHLGIPQYTYKAEVYLREEERAEAKKRLADKPKPWISVNIMSREGVKIWPREYWSQLLEKLRSLGTVVQLGDETEPELIGTMRFAGQLSMRESMAVLAEMDLHIGPESFLMHAANGVGVPAVIIFGGARLPIGSGYAENTNLENRPECSPCWLHTTRGDICPNQMKCMTGIKPETVLKAVMDRLSSSVKPG